MGKLFSAFKTDFIDGLDGGLTQTVNPPTCTGEAAMRTAGYGVTSDPGNTVFWCLGQDAGGTPLLKITDHRRYPLEISHPGATTVENSIDWGQFASLSHWGSGTQTVLEPGGTVTYKLAMPANSTATIGTQLDGFGQSLYALQVGITTLVSILTRFGAGGVEAAKVSAKMLTAASCTDAIGKGSGALISGCFDAATLFAALGTKALLLVPLMVFGPLIASSKASGTP